MILPCSRVILPCLIGVSWTEAFCLFCKGVKMGAALVLPAAVIIGLGAAYLLRGTRGGRALVNCLTFGGMDEPTSQRRTILKGTAARRWEIRAEDLHGLSPKSSSEYDTDSRSSQQ